MSFDGLAEVASLNLATGRDSSPAGAAIQKLQCGSWRFGSPVCDTAVGLLLQPNASGKMVTRNTKTPHLPRPLNPSSVTYSALLLVPPRAPWLLLTCLAADVSYVELCGLLS